MQMYTALRVSYKFIFIINLAVAAFFSTPCCHLIMYVSIQCERLIKFAFVFNSYFNSRAQSLEGWDFRISNN